MKLAKEKVMYEKEAKQQEEKIEKMKAEACDDYGIKKQLSPTLPMLSYSQCPCTTILAQHIVPLYSLITSEIEILQESRMMIPDCQRRLEVAHADLTQLLTRSSVNENRAEQPQLSQPVLIGEVFHPSDHFCGPPLDLLLVHVLPVLSTPELDAVLQVGSRQSKVEGQSHLPGPAGHASFDAAQDMAAFLGCECTLPAHVQLFTHQYPQDLLCSAALNPFIPQPVLILGVALTQVQDLALGLVEPHEVHMGQVLELVQVPLDGIPSLRRVNCTTQLGVIYKFAEGALDPTVYVIDEDIKQYWSQYRPLRDTTHH
ncbi:hypothetical protein QYF61_027095 [Mycteria americana]|uniref:Tubulin-specific chaperone A n=1 Tax=Mycteria americana TaxID=33587 RepID=A0AAN7S2D7_MYCAM|nr:hypothetical protein QYF61_027095 [Mycteria americana]